MKHTGQYRSAPFDGEWKGKLVADAGGRFQNPILCMFREKYFDATAKGNRFLAIIDQEGDNRKFEGSIGKDGKLSIWGEWKLTDAHLVAAWGTEGKAHVAPMKMSGVFSKHRFNGRVWGETGGNGRTPPACRGTMYLARAPLTVDEVEAEATAADPELYKKVKALEKLLGQAAKAEEAPSVVRTAEQK